MPPIAITSTSVIVPVAQGKSMLEEGPSGPSATTVYGWRRLKGPQCRRSNLTPWPVALARPDQAGEGVLSG